MTILIADRLPLIRLGIMSIIKPLGYKAEIHEISMPAARIDQRNRKDILLIISASSLLEQNDVSGAQISFLNEFGTCILVQDRPLEAEVLSHFSEVIEANDNESTIQKKIERQLMSHTDPESPDQESREISPREEDVLRLVAMGLTNKEIAEKLFISSHTVITHRKNITAKLGIKTIAGLTVYAIINHLISLDDIREG